MTRIRQNELHARRKRLKTLRRLRERYASAGSGSIKEKIVQKVSRVAPYLTSQEFLDLVKKKRA